MIAILKRINEFKMDYQKRNQDFHNDNDNSSDNNEIGGNRGSDKERQDLSNILQEIQLISSIHNK